MNKPLQIYFGGSFDPPHLGHLLMAEIASDQLQAPVTFVPAGVPPHKNVCSTAADRLAMVSLAIAGNDWFSVDDLEVKRPEPAYTYQTLAYLQEREQLTPDSLLFLIGSDSLIELETWRRPERIADLCTLLVYPRHNYEAEDLAGICQRLQLRLKICQAPIVQISSTFIRQRIKQNKSIKYMLPENVARYITENNLYREGNSPGALNG